MSSSFFPVVGFPNIPDGIPDMDDLYEEECGLVEEFEDIEDGFVKVNITDEESEYEIIPFPK